MEATRAAFRAIGGMCSFALNDKTPALFKAAQGF